MTIINPPITRTDATAIVNEAFAGQRQLLAIVPLGGGQVNSTGMLILDDGTRCILRIAPDPASAAEVPGWLSPYGLRREAAVIAAAGPALAHLLPHTIAHNFTGSLLPRDWVVQEVMPGVPLETLLPSLDDDVATEIWREVGAFMRSLHDRGQPPFGPLVDGVRRETWLDLVQADLAGLQDDFARYGLPGDDLDRLANAVERHAAVLAAAPAALIHSDLNPAHIFITDREDDGTLCLGGIIDLEYGRVADPLSDHLLATAIETQVSSEASRAILDGYADADLGPGITPRIQIAAALGAAWDATLLACQQQDAAPALDRVAHHLADLEAD